MSAWHQTDPNKAARDRQRTELLAKSPLRKPVAQDDTTDCPLFAAVDQGKML